MVSLVLATALISGLMILTLAPAAPAATAATAPVTAYVTDFNSAGPVTPIDVATNTAGSPIPVGNKPLGVAFSPDGSTVYVTNFSSNTITPINTATNTPGTPITVGLAPGGIVVTPNGTTAYVVLNTESVASVNLATGHHRPLHQHRWYTKWDRDHPGRQDRLCHRSDRQSGMAD
jgi:YVTN family beta-propeller protein